MAPISLLRSSTSASNHSSSVSASASAAAMASSASSASKNIPTPASSVWQQANNHQATVGGGGGVGSMVLNNPFSHSKHAIKPCASTCTVRSSAAAVIPSHLPINLPRPPPPDAAARLLRNASNLNYCSSGSNHEPSSMCLAAMVHDFLEEESDGSMDAGDHFDYNFVQARGGACGLARCNCVDGVCSDVGHDDASDQSVHQGASASGISKSTEQLCEILEGVSTSSVSPVKRPELALLFEVAKAVEMETEDLMAGAGGSRGSMEKQQSMDDACLDDENSSKSSLMNRLRRPVMRRLRQEGYNAAVCKSRWSHRDGVPAGDYEYIDVILESSERSPDDQKSGKSERLIVDIDFRAQFEIARASAQYTQLLGVLPRIFVGKVERLKQILKIMCDAAKRSLKEQGLHMPPWRKLKYMQAKWFSAYRRTTNVDMAGQTPGSVSVSEEECNKQQLSRDRADGMDRQGHWRVAVDPDYHDIHESRLQLAGCRGSAYRVFSTAFTKEMDMVFFNSKGTRPGPRPAPGPERPAIVATVVCTDWELPALEKKKPAPHAAHPSAAISSTCSGLSKALKTLVSANVLL